MANMKKWGGDCLLVGWFGLVFAGESNCPSDREPHSFGKLTSEALTGENPGSAIVTPVWGVLPQQ